MRIFLISSSVNFRLGDDHGAVAFADAAPAGHQGVIILHVRVSVEGDSGDVVKRFVDRQVVQCLDVLEGVIELEAGNADLIRGKAIEHKGVIGVGGCARC